MGNKEIVKQTLAVLNGHSEWKSIYNRYAKDLENNKSKYEECSKIFQVRKPIMFIV